MLTVLHAGGKFDKGSYKVSGGLHWSRCVVRQRIVDAADRRSASRRQDLPRDVQQGRVPTSKLEIVGECSDRGTAITFKPDGEFFTHTTEYKYEILSNRLRELAFLNKGVSSSRSPTSG